MGRNLLILVIMSLFFMETSYSQTHFGVRIGANMSNVTKFNLNSKSRFGAQAGAFALIPFSREDMLFFQPEINYSTQGEFNNVRNPEGDQIKQKVFLNYINIPLHMKIYIDDLYFEGGPYLGFMIRENVEKFDFYTEADQVTFSDLDFGLSIGFGFSFDRKVELSLRYSYGLSDQVSNDPVNAVNRTSLLNFGVSYIFDYYY